MPKKDGGVRIVTIATTIYRLMMEADNEEVVEFEKEHHFYNDSAAAGASVVRVTGGRISEG